MLEELEGRVHLLYFRNELQQFKSFLAGIVARRVANKTEDPEAMLRLLLPEGDPMETAREVVGGQAAGQRGLFDQALGLDRCGVHEQIATLARTDEDRGKLAACAYLGFDGLCSLADGNVGIFMDICHRAWENARLLDTWSGKTGARIAPLCQVQAAASFAAERNKDIEIGSPEGPHVMNFVDEVCHELKKRPGLQQERNYDSWNVQLEEPIELSEHTVRALQAGFQHRVFVPRSIEGFDALPQRLNVCGFLLLHRGVVDLARPPLEVSPGDANNWMRHLPREMTRPPVNIRPSAPPQKVAHKGFLSVSFRKEEPASMVRARLLDIFGRTDPTIRCCDATAFGAYGSPRLLEKVRSYVDREATFCLVEVSNITPNTMLELGLATGLNRRFWTLSSLDRVGALPDWIGGLAIVLYALDKNKPQHFLDTVVHNQIVSPLSGITKRTFCPHWRNLTWCPYKISKDPNVVHISFPEGDNLWSLVTDRLRHDRTLREFRLTTDSDIGPALPGTPDAVCVRCYAVRNAGTVFVATTPPSGPVTFDAQTDGPRHDPLQCFVLGMAFALRRNCHHLYEDGRGGQLTMWKGYPVFSWKTAEEAHDYALRTLQALLRTRKRNDPRILPEQKE
jgi:hypothetical protein